MKTNRNGNRNTEMEKIYFPSGGVVMIEYDKACPKPKIKAFGGV